MPKTPHIEFAAISPKANHLTMNIAGDQVTVAGMNYFLQGPAHKLLSFADCMRTRNPKDFRYFKGWFPISVAKGFYGHHYVTIGCAAGLVRAFKG